MRGVSPAAASIIDFLKSTHRQRRPATANPVAELDTESAVARAIDYLKGPAPEAIEGNGGDAETYKVACQLRDFGISAERALDLLHEHWNETKASPPWPADQLARKVENAFNYATGQWAGYAASTDFEVVTEILEQPKKPKPRLFWLPFTEARETALQLSATPLIEGLLDCEAMSVIYGDSNSGKTFVMLDLAYHIAAGMPWQGRDTAQGLVVYVAAEGGQGIKKRLAALHKQYGRDVPLALVPCPVNMLDAKVDAAELVKMIREAEAHFGCSARLVVIDTLSRALAGGDENASTDMGVFVRNVDRVRAEVKAHLNIVHHSGKDQSRGARGWSGLRAATDTEIEIIAGEIRFTKQRDMDPAKAMKFVLDPVSLGKDAKGRAITSCVVRITTGSEFIQVELTGEAQEMFEAFCVAAKQQVLDRGEPLANWQSEPVSTQSWEMQYILAWKERKQGQPLEAEQGGSSACSAENANSAEVPENTEKSGNLQKSSAAPVSARYLRGLRNKVMESGTVLLTLKNQWVMAQTEQRNN